MIDGTTLTLAEPFLIPALIIGTLVSSGVSIYQAANPPEMPEIAPPEDTEAQANMATANAIRARRDQFTPTVLSENEFLHPTVVMERGPLGPTTGETVEKT